MKCSCRPWDLHHPDFCAPTYIERLRKLVNYPSSFAKNLSLCYDQITRKSIQELERNHIQYRRTSYITAFPEHGIYGCGGCVYCGKNAFYKHKKIIPTIRIGKP